MCKTDNVCSSRIALGSITKYTVMWSKPSIVGHDRKNEAMNYLTSKISVKLHHAFTDYVIKAGPAIILLQLYISQVLPGSAVWIYLVSYKVERATTYETKIAKKLNLCSLGGIYLHEVCI